MKKRKINPGLKAHVEELRSTRKSADEFIFNFLNNIQRPAALVRFVLDTDKDGKVFQTAIEQYLCSIVTCWETFFRDIFVFLCDIDAKFQDAAAVASDTDPQSASGSGISGAELLSKSFNFQCIDDIEKAFTFIFDNEPVLFTIGQQAYRFPNMKSDKIYLASIHHSLPGWMNLVRDLLKERHSLTHNANFRSELNRKVISWGEAIFLFVPQYFGVYVNKRYKLPTVMLNTKDKQLAKGLKEELEVMPYFFTIQDLLADDWEILDEPTGT